ncbi:MAG: hypothetical protein KDE56_05030 [Anaerolineales bacterium]|nr:hypothetical protein [Anaerolineales bacterium]
MESSLNPVKQLVKIGAGVFMLLLSILFFTPHLAAQANTYSTYLPIAFKAVPTPILQPLTRSSSENSWTATWNQPASDITRYEVREAPNTNFESPLFYNTTETNYAFSTPASINNSYCYQVRAIANEIPSIWSNTRCIVGDYYDDFSSGNSGWAIRRQDTDDVDNSAFYENGEFALKLRGRWDYAIASPLAEAPTGAYRLETRVRFDSSVDNLHAYGIIFGGDWNGLACPTDHYWTCFNQYYRLLVIWHGSPDTLRVNLKRIDSHDPEDNAGRGITLVDYKEVSMNPNDWNTWAVEVHDNGDIVVLVNGRVWATVNDSTYLANRYFGVFAASDEYLGAEPHFDHYGLTHISE